MAFNLSAILADIGDSWEHEKNRAMLVQWYWNGVFGELYGSTVETRIARDFVEVPAWLKGGPEPTTIAEATFRADRLKTMRMRLSAAYKGVNALLMKEGAQDFRSGQKFDHTIFFAGSGPCRATIPPYAGPPFQTMPGHRSGACRATVPADAGRGMTRG